MRRVFGLLVCLVCAAVLGGCRFMRTLEGAIYGSCGMAVSELANQGWNAAASFLRWRRMEATAAAVAKRPPA